jgi:hypothetical protein
MLRGSVNLILKCAPLCLGLTDTKVACPDTHSEQPFGRPVRLLYDNGVVVTFFIENV